FSFAWGENKVYRFFEHIYIGIAAAHAVVMGVTNVKNNAWIPLTTKGKFVLIVPIILGLLMYTRFFKGYAWISRYPISFIIGLGVGMTIKGTIVSQFLAQLKATMLPLNSFNNLVVIFGTTAVLLFFYFSKERTGVLNQYTQFGRWILMMSFGATFGNAVMGEMTLLIGRLQFIFGPWLGLVK
ncbi:MAG: hypothetical protein ACM3ZQ_03445, partial [Bacillota bacterium]